MTAILSKDQMERLTTKRLLAYRDSLLTWHETCHYDDDYDESKCKAGQLWKATYATVKEVLAKREHVNRPTTGK